MSDRISHSGSWRAPRPFGPFTMFAVSALCSMALAACGGDGKGSADDAAASAQANAQQGNGGAVSTCSNADTTPVALAVRDYIAKSSPTPQRFLAAQGTDSALPDDGFKVLQDKGPTYFYSSDSSAQRQIRDKLLRDGPYASLLIVYHGQQPASDGAGTDIRLGSQYIGGELDGKRAVSKRYAIRCDSTGWRIASTTEEPAS